MFDRLLDQKVNKDELNDTVNRVDFDNELEKFAVYIKELSEKFNDDQVREKANKIDESVLEKMCRKDDVSNFTQKIEKRLLCKYTCSSYNISLESSSNHYLALKSLVDRSLKGSSSQVRVFSISS